MSLLERAGTPGRSTGGGDARTRGLLPGRRADMARGEEPDSTGKHLEPIVKRPPRTHQVRARRDLGMVLFVLVVLALAVGLPAYFLAPRERPYVLANYTYAEVKLGEFKDVVGAPGTVVPAHAVDVRAGASGVVQDIMVAPGEEVEPGTVVCVLHSADLVARREEAKRQVLVAEDNLRKTRLDGSQAIDRIKRDLGDAERNLGDARAKLEDARKLYEAGAIPRKQLEEAEGEVDRARSLVDARRADLSAAKAGNALQVDACERQVEVTRSSLRAIDDTIESLVLHSPIRGKILDVAVVPGATVSQGTVVAQVADLARLVVKARVDSSSVRLVTQGQPATVNFGGRICTGSVQYVAPRAEETGQGTAVDVRISLSSPPDDVPPNSAAYVEIEVRQRSGVPCLPRGAFLASGQEMFVYVITGDRAVQRDVRYGATYGNAVEVLDGLAVGEKVITSSYEEFKDRREVRVLPEGGRRQ